MIGILGGMGTQAGLDFCNKLAVLNRGKIDQEYPLFLLYNKSNIPGRPESIGSQTKKLSNKSTNKTSREKYNKVLKSLLKGCKLLEKNKCKFIVIPCNTAHYWFEDLQNKSLALTRGTPFSLKAIKRFSAQLHNIETLDQAFILIDSSRADFTFTHKKLAEDIIKKHNLKNSAGTS